MPAVADLVLGLDSGGTKTLLALADRAGVVHRLARGPSLDPFAERRWPEHLDAIVRSIEPFLPRIAAAALGLSCHGEVEAVSARQRAAVAALLPMPHLVLNDVRVAFDGALAGRAGVLLLAGTGSMAWAGDGGERDVRIGGWGDAYGDEGSAFWIGREALSAVTRDLDGRAPGLGLAVPLLDRLGVGAPELNERFFGAPNRRSAIAGVARHVNELAEAGHPRASEILLRAARWIADHASAARLRLDLPSDAAWSFAGGVFASRAVMAEVARRIGRAPQAPRLPPVGGALLRAAKLAGWAADEPWIGRLAATLADAHEANAGSLPAGTPQEQPVLAEGGEPQS